MDTAETSTLVAEDKSTHRVETFVLDRLVKHPNADSLSLIKIGDTDYTYVAKTEDWTGNIGKTVAWIPHDSVVKLDRPEFAFLSLSQKNGRIRAKKLRGIVSYGLLVLAPAGINPGDDAATALEVTHYEPETVQSKNPKSYTMASEAADPPAGAYVKYDVEAFLKYGRKAFTPGEPVYVSEKLHGANARYVFRDGVMYCGSRTEWKAEYSQPSKITLEELTAKIGDPEKAKAVFERAVTGFKPKKNMWWLALDATPALRTFCEQHPGWCVYGEVFGNVQNMKYGANAEVWFRAFDILTQSETGTVWMHAENFTRTCDAFSLPRVPEIGVMPFDFDQLVALAEGNTLIPGASHIREGIVVKPIRERWDERVGRVAFKIINPAYLEKN